MITNTIIADATLGAPKSCEEEAFWEFLLTIIVKWAPNTILIIKAPVI